MPLQLPSSDPQPLPAGLYATDAFHRHPLLMVDGDVVRSWNEAHALHGPARLSDVNPAYVARSSTATTTLKQPPTHESGDCRGLITCMLGQMAWWTAMPTTHWLVVQLRWNQRLYINSCGKVCSTT